MTDRFVDQYIDACVASYPCVSSPRWSTDLVMVDSGAENANARWADVLHRFELPEVIREMTAFNAIRDHWMVMRGPFHVWPFRDPLDFASIALVKPNTVPAYSNADQVLGTGDGFTTEFQLYKTYVRGSQTYSRLIELPVVSSILIAGAGSPSVPPITSISRPGGIVRFAWPPESGQVMTWGGLFDVPVRFENDESFDGVVRSLTLAGNASLTFMETKVC